MKKHHNHNLTQNNRNIRNNNNNNNNRNSKAIKIIKPTVAALNKLGYAHANTITNSTKTSTNTTTTTGTTDFDSSSGYDDNDRNEYKKNRRDYDTYGKRCTIQAMPMSKQQIFSHSNITDLRDEDNNSNIENQRKHFVVKIGSNKHRTTQLTEIRTECTSDNTPNVCHHLPRLTQPKPLSQTICEDRNKQNVQFIDELAEYTPKSSQLNDVQSMISIQTPHMTNFQFREHIENQALEYSI